MITAQSADGTQHQFPDGTDPAVVDKVMKDYAQQGAAKPSAQPVAPPPDAPSIMDRIQANPVIGAPAQSLLRAGQGVEQLVAHGAASASDLGGVEPNTFSRVLHSIADHIDASVSKQNQGYEEAGQRVDAASTNPRVSQALRATGEVAGNMLNPAGTVGNTLKVTPGMIGAAERAAASGAGFAASQPTAGGDNYWTDKATQVATGAGVGAVAGTAAEKLGGGGKPAAPKASDFKSAATDAYNEAEKQGVVIKQDSFKNAAADIKDQVEERGIDPALQPRATAVLNRLDKEAEAGDLTFKKAMMLRRVATSALSTPDKSDRAATHMIIDGLDDYMKGLKPSDLTGQVTGDPVLMKALDLPSGDASTANAALKTANDLYARGAKLDTIDRLVEKANDKVGANYTVAGFDTALRQQFGQLKRNQAAWRQFNPAEQDAITQIIRGTPGQNIARQVGKIAPQGSLNILSELGAIAGALYEGQPALAASVAGAAGIGAIAKGKANRMGAENVSALQNVIANKGGNALAAPRPAPNALVWNPIPQLAVNALLQPRP